MAFPRWIIEIPDHLKTHEMCKEAMRINPPALSYVPDHLQTQEIVRIDQCYLEFVPDQFKTQEVGDAAGMEDLCAL